MKCVKCGTEVSKNAKFCRTCGAPLELQKNVENTSTENATQVSVTNELDKKIDNTNELFFGHSNSSKKIEEILNEMSPEEKNPDEATMLIPSDLIKKYSKNNSEVKVEEKNVEETLVKPEGTKVEETKVEEHKQEVKEEVKTEAKEDKNDLSKLFSEKKEEVKENKEIKQEEPIKDEKVVTPVEKPKDDIPEKVNKPVEEKKEETKKEQPIEKKETKTEIKEVETIDEEFESESDSKKPHYGRTFFVFFIIFVFACAIGYLIFVLYTSRDELEKIDKENVDLKEQLTTIKKGTNSSEDSSNSVIYNGFKFQSDAENYKIEDNNLVLNIDDTTYVIKIKNSITYDSIKDKKEEYRLKLVNSGYIIKSYGNKHIDDRDYYVFEATDKAGKKYIIAYSSLDNQNVIAFVISNEKNNIDYNVLQRTNLIISSASKETTSATNDVDIFVEK